MQNKKAAMITCCADHGGTGYRRLAYRMLDEDVAAVSLSSVYFLLLKTGRLRSSQAQPSRKGQGFHQPQRLH